MYVMVPSTCLLRDVRGVALVEQVIIAVLLLVGGIAAWQAFGKDVHCASGQARGQFAQLDGDPGHGEDMDCPK